MEITTDELLAEAGQMALELRLKDRALARLEAENAELTALLESSTEPRSDDHPAPPSGDAAPRGPE